MSVHAAHVSSDGVSLLKDYALELEIRMEYSSNDYLCGCA